MRKILVFGVMTLSFFALQGQTHVVKKNETLGGIAQKYGVSVGSLQALNGITNPNLLFVGKNSKSLLPESQKLLTL